MGNPANEKNNVVSDKVIKVYCDGLCNPNPNGIATYGWVAYESGEKINEFFSVIASGLGATNNVAEYSALIAAMGWLLAQGYCDRKIVIHMDSQLVVKQIAGQYAVSSPKIQGLYEQAKGLARVFSNLSLKRIPREENVEADALSNLAYKGVASRKLSLSEKADLLVDTVKRTDEYTFRVASQSKANKVYYVDLRIPSCTCPDFCINKRKQGLCKHMLAVYKHINLSRAAR